MVGPLLICELIFLVVLVLQPFLDPRNNWLAAKPPFSTPSLLESYISFIGKPYRWIWRQQEGGSRVATVDILHYIQVGFTLLSCTLIAKDALEVTVVLCCPYQINYWGRIMSKYWQAEGMMVLCACGLLAQMENEGSML